MYLILPLNFFLDEKTPKFNRKYNKEEFTLLAEKTNKKIKENKLNLNIYNNSDYLQSKINNPFLCSNCCVGTLQEIIVKNNKVFFGINVFEENYIHIKNTKVSFMARYKNNDINNFSLEEFLGFYLDF